MGGYTFCWHYKVATNDRRWPKALDTDYTRDIGIHTFIIEMYDAKTGNSALVFRHDDVCEVKLDPLDEIKVSENLWHSSRHCKGCGGRRQRPRGRRLQIVFFDGTLAVSFIVENTRRERRTKASCTLLVNEGPDSRQSKRQHPPLWQKRLQISESAITSIQWHARGGPGLPFLLILTHHSPRGSYISKQISAQRSNSLNGLKKTCSNARTISHFGSP